MAKIIGGTAATSMLIPDWNQTNPNKADYIKNKPEVANPIKGIAVVLESDGVDEGRITIDDFSPFPQELKIECTRDIGGAYLVVYDDNGFVAEIHNTGGDYYTYDGYHSFPVDGKPLAFEAIAGDFQIEYNRDTNKAIGDVESALDAIIAMQNQLIGGDSE